MKHFRFKGYKRRYEIDVIGFEEPFIFLRLNVNIGKCIDE